jgi:hypothetical protein
MENHVAPWEDRLHATADTPPTIGQVLAELLTQYQVRFPQVRITVIETPVTAI